ncbi:MAG: hypothetical protein OXR68_01225 [Alphaproteobacteria bacterium]|nr:hypothetical protein [Alphaproteobacteria bacterium]MDD9919232.1 hypothetical protein [Alphaproteobacteria bacterium]
MNSREITESFTDSFSHNFVLWLLVIVSVSHIPPISSHDLLQWAANTFPLLLAAVVFAFPTTDIFRNWCINIIQAWLALIFLGLFMVDAWHFGASFWVGLLAFFISLLCICFRD